MKSNISRFGALLLVILVSLLSVGTKVNAGVSYPPTSDTIQHLAYELHIVQGIPIGSEATPIPKDGYVFITLPGTADGAAAFKVSFTNPTPAGYREPILTPYGSTTSVGSMTETGQRVQGGPILQSYGEFKIGSQKVFAVCNVQNGETTAQFYWGLYASVDGAGADEDRAQFAVPAIGSPYRGAELVKVEPQPDGGVILTVDQDTKSKYEVIASSDLQSWTMVTQPSVEVPGSKGEVAGVTFNTVRFTLPWNGTKNGFFNLRFR